MSAGTEAGAAPGGLAAAAKFSPPPLRAGLVARSRLLERLNAGLRLRLSLISGAAGTGKTTLLAQWLASLAAGGVAFAWLSVEEADADPAQFLRDLSAALSAVAPMAANTSPAGNGASLEAAAGAILSGLAATAREVAVIVDGLHLARSPRVDEVISSLLERLPPRVHLVLGTRATPALGLARLRAQGEGAARTRSREPGASASSEPIATRPTSRPRKSPCPPTSP